MVLKAKSAVATSSSSVLHYLSAMDKRDHVGHPRNMMSLEFIITAQPTKDSRPDNHSVDQMASELLNKYVDRVDILMPKDIMRKGESISPGGPVLSSQIEGHERASVNPQIATESKPNHDFYFENQRMYHGYRKGVYMVPCDEQEQDRLDFLHKAFSLAIRSNRLIHVPHPTSAKILDLGCGTGLWAIDLAERNPGASVVGVDLSPIQPSNHPLNCQFYAPFDFESPWHLGEDYWDVIHLRMGCGSVASWHSLYRRVLAHLRRGAWFEQVEIDFEPRCANWALKESHLQYWYQNLKLATEQSMRPLAHRSEETLNKLQEVGFTEIRHHQIRLPLSPWHQGDQERLVGRWYGLAFLQSMESLSLAPFSRILGWSPDRIHQLLFNAKSEAFNNQTQGFHILNIYQARKPTSE